MFAGRPDPPTDLTVENVTYNSVTLKWNPGFDGGDKQKYVVKYNWADHGSTIEVDPPSSTQFTIEGVL